MPWKAVKAKGGGYDIVKSTTGERVGHSETKAQAQASVNARYAAEGGAKMGKGRKKR